MKNKNILILVLLGLTTGCLQTREQLRGDIAGKEEQVVAQKEVITLQQKEAEEAIQSQELEEQLRIMTGRIEGLENELRLEDQRKLKMAKGTVDSQAALNEKMRLFEEAITRLEGKVDELQKELVTIKKAKTAAAPAKKKVGNFIGAEAAFSKKKWKEAIAGYQKYRELNPRGKRYASATYKIGVSFEELGMKSEASSFYKEVIAKFPKSKIVKKAKYRLSKI